MRRERGDEGLADCHRWPLCCWPGVRQKYRRHLRTMLQVPQQWRAPLGPDNASRPVERALVAQLQRPGIDRASCHGH
jgi:hypothetical protein